MSDETFKAYLLSLDIPAEDKSYVLKFFKKADYFESLREVVTKDTNQVISMGYGNLNSKIGFIMQDSSIFESVKELLLEYMNKFDMNIWNVYITFINKVDIDYDERFSLLVHELHAVGPEVLYFFVTDEEHYLSTLNEYKKFNINLPRKVFKIIVPEAGADKNMFTDNALEKQFFGMFKYLINYKETE